MSDTSAIFSDNTIQSLDIDTTKFSVGDLERMKIEFPCQSNDDLARFLIARNGNYDAAVAMFRSHLMWLRDTPKPTKELCSNMLARKWIYVNGEDRERHPLMIARMCRHDSRNRDLSEMHREMLWWLDILLSVMPADRSKFTVLIDRVNATSVNQDTEFLKSIAPVFQNNFPERSYRVIIYPSGLVFYGIWNVMQWLLDPVTRKKVAPQMSPEGIFEFIDPKYVPQDMGGSCTFEPDIERMEDPPSLMHHPLELLARTVEVGDYVSTVSSEECAQTGELDERSSQVSAGSSVFSFHTTRQTEALPAIMRGWAVKEGHLVKNWKRRYFVLSSNNCATVLRYYFQQDPQHTDQEPFGLDLMGQLDLRQYTLELHRHDSILHLLPPRSGGKHLHMHLEDRDQFEAWVEALSEHLQFREKADRLEPPPPDSDCIIL